MPESALTAPSDVVNLRGLIRIRWFVYLGLLLLVSSISQLARVRFDVTTCAVLVFVGLASNAAARLAWLRALGLRRVSFGLLALDVLLLTALLSASGGPTSPLVLGYVLPLLVAATILSRRALWALLMLTAVAVVTTIAVHSSLTPDHTHVATQAAWHHPGHVVHNQREHLWLHVRGLWAALVVLIVLVVYVVRWAFEQRDSELASLRSELEKNARLAELWTLAASAAHELGTPLSTISVIAKELELRARRGRLDASSAADLSEICEQLVRCRAVLSNMSNDARSRGREPNVELTLAQFVGEARDVAPEPERIRVELPPVAAQSLGSVPRRLLGQVLHSLLENALEASPPGAPVLLRATSTERDWAIIVEDSGPGLPTDAAARLGEEPFSTKPSGMGVGLFLSRAILDRLGGSLRLDSGSTGTRVHLTLPRRPLALGAG